MPPRTTPRNPRYEIVDGRIVTRSLELHIVDHCNLQCAECCSLSPLLEPRTVSPEAISRDLGLACRVLSPHYLKLVGGEPLLHPELIACLEAARPFADILSVTTNGILLERMPARFWEVIDALTLSLYPAPRLSEQRLASIKQRAAHHGVELNIKRQDDFVRMSHWGLELDERQADEVFATCWLRERCHILSEGRFYMCTRPPHYRSFFKSDKGLHEDGVALHAGESLRDEIHQYLQRSEALKTCRYCAGTEAEPAKHRMLSRAEIEAIRERYS